MAGTGYYANIKQKAPLTDSFNQKGQSNQANLRAAFANSPIIGEPADGDILSEEERLEIHRKLVMDGVTLNGNGFNEFSPNYKETPDIANLDIESLNLPSPYIPNPTSPGPGSLNASDKPAFEGEVKNPQTINQFGSGNKGTYNPKTSAKKISDLKIGEYIPGDSGGN